MPGSITTRGLKVVGFGASMVAGMMVVSMLSAGFGGILGFGAGFFLGRSGRG